MKQFRRTSNQIYGGYNFNKTEKYKYISTTHHIDINSGDQNILLDSENNKISIISDNLIDLSSENILIEAQDNITLDASGRASIVLDTSDSDVVVTADKNIDLYSNNINVLGQDKITLDASGRASIVLDTSDSNVVVTSDEISLVTSSSYPNSNYGKPTDISYDISGTDQFGKSVALNNAGNRLVVGAYTTNDVYIYNLDNSGNSTIIYTIQNTQKNFGYSVTLNNAGTRLVVGSPDLNKVSIYNLDDSGIPTGASYEIPGAGKFGSAVALDGSGDRLVVGTFEGNLVYIYNLDNSGNPNGGISYELSDTSYSFGQTVALNNAGDRLVVGVFASGLAYIYNLNNNGNPFVGISYEINIENVNHAESVALNNAGDRLVVGDNLNNKAHIYNLDNSGNPNGGISYEITGTDNFGYAVALNNEGNRLVVGADDSNTVYIYNLDNSGNANGGISYEITGTGKFGSAVALNGSGDRLVVGSLELNQVSIYNLDNSEEIITYNNNILINGNNTDLSSQNVNLLAQDKIKLVASCASIVLDASDCKVVVTADENIDLSSQKVNVLALEKITLDASNCASIVLDTSDCKVVVTADENIDLSSQNVNVLAQDKIILDASNCASIVLDSSECSVVVTADDMIDLSSKNILIQAQEELKLKAETCTIDADTLNQVCDNYDITAEKFIRENNLINWVTTITGHNSEYPVNLKIDNQNNVYMTGNSNSFPITITQLSLKNNSILSVDISYVFGLTSVLANDDIFLIKYDKDGSLNWVTTITGLGHEYPVNLQLDNQDNVYITGRSNSNPITITQLSLNNSDLVVDVSYDVSLNINYDAFLIKYDKDGSLNWVTTVTGTDSVLEKSLQIDNQDNVYITGSSSSDKIKINQLTLDTNNQLAVDISYDVSLTGNINYDTFLIKYDKDGSLNWVTTITGNANEHPINLQIDNQDNVYITRTSRKHIIEIKQFKLHSNQLVIDVSYQFSLTGNQDAFLIKYDKDGKLNWVITITEYRYKALVNLQIDNQNNVYMTGWSDNTQCKISKLILSDNQLGVENSYDVHLSDVISYETYIIKYDKDGSLIWITSITAPSSEYPTSLQLDNQDNVYITGRSNSDKININKLILSDNQYNVDVSYDVSLTSNGYDVFLIKYDKDGSLKRVTTITEIDDQILTNLQLDNSNNVYITGSSTSNSIKITELSLKNNSILSVDVSYDVSLNSEEDAFLIKYNDDGQLNWVTTVTETNNERPVNLQIDSNNNVYMSGRSTSNQIKITELSLKNNELSIDVSYDVGLNNNYDAFLIKIKESFVNIKSSFKLTNETIEMESKNISLDASCARIVLDASECKVVVTADEKIDLSSNNINILAQDKITLDASNCASIVLDTSECEVVVTADEKIDLSSQNVNVLAQDKIILDASNCASIVLDASECKVVVTADENIDLSSQNVNVLAQDKITLDTSNCASIVLDASECKVVVTADNNIDLSSNSINVIAQDKITLDASCASIVLDSSECQVVVTADEKIDLSSKNISIQAQEEVKFKAGIYTIDADTLNQVCDNYEITVENFQRENNLIDWISTVAGSSNVYSEYPVNLQIDNNNNVYMTGYTYNNKITITNITLNNSILEVDISYDVGLTGGSQNRDAFLIKYDKDGSLNWISTIKGQGFTDEPVSLQIDNQDNVYMCGKSNSTLISIIQYNNNNNNLVSDASYNVSLTGNNYDTYLIKYDKDGSLNWVSTVTGTDSVLEKSLQIDNNNNVYMTGYSSSNPITIKILILDSSGILSVDISYDIGITGVDTFLIKYDQYGDLKWVSTITGNANEHPINLQIDNQDNVCMFGTSNSDQIKINQLILNSSGILSVDISYVVGLTGNNNSDAFLIKYDKDGSLNWVSTFTGTGNVLAKSLQIDDQNNVYITGSSYKNPITIKRLILDSSGILSVDISYDVIGNDIFLIKYDKDGSLNWVSIITGPGESIQVNLQIDNQYNVYITGWNNVVSIANIVIAQLSLNNSILSTSGTYYVGLDNTAAFLIKYDKDGSLNWVSTITTLDSFDKPVSLQIDDQNNVYMTGHSKSKQMTIKRLILNNSILSVDISYDVGINNGHVFLIKYHQDGSLNWISTITGTNNDRPVSLQIDNQNNVYMTGESYSNPITITQLILDTSGILSVDVSYDVSLNNAGAFLIKMKEYILNPNDKSSFKVTNKTIEMESNLITLDASCASIVLDSSDCNVVIKATEIVPGSDGTCNLGSTTHKFKDIHFSGDLIQSGTTLSSINNIITYLDTDYTGYDFVYDSVYSNISSQLYEARRAGSTFYLTCLLLFNREPTYNGGNTYIYIPIPTSIKNILETEYPPINNNEIYFFVYNGYIVPSNHNGVYSNAQSGAVKYDALGYEGTHLRIEYKDYNTTNTVTGPCECRMDIRFAPRVTE